MVLGSGLVALTSRNGGSQPPDRLLSEPGIFKNKKFAPNVRILNTKGTESIFNNEQQNTNAEISGKAQQINTVDYSDREGVLRQLQKGEAETANLSYEVNYSVTKDGKVWKIAGESGMVDLSAIVNDLRGAYSYHNHPSEKTHYSFSGEDVAFFIYAGENYSKASDDAYEYMMWRTEETIEKSYDEVYHRFKEILQKDVYALAWDGLIDIDIDGYHEAMKRLSKELRFGYERRKKGSH